MLCHLCYSSSLIVAYAYSTVFCFVVPQPTVTTQSKCDLSADGINLVIGRLTGCVTFLADYVMMCISYTPMRINMICCHLTHFFKHHLSLFFQESLQ